MLAKFNIIVTTDSEWGMSRDGKIPWTENNGNTSSREFFRKMTCGKGKNVVIMGASAFSYMGKTPLAGRKNYVVSKERFQQVDFTGVVIVSSLLEALQSIGESLSYDEVYIMGGTRIIEEALSKFGYLCNRVYITKLKLPYKCDKRFPIELLGDSPKTFSDVEATQNYERHFYLVDSKHDEYKYLELVSKILTSGEFRKNRTGISTQSIFSHTLQFDISENIPIFTTRKINYNAIIEELLMFVSGKTNTNTLTSKIWTGNTSEKFLRERGLDYDEGDMGPSYGFQWRHWGAEYDGMDKDYTGQGIDQLANAIDLIKQNPDDRRIVVSAWNVGDLDKMALPPCHLFFQFYVSGNKLDCQVYMRSCDVALGLPFNVASYAMLVRMIGVLTGKEARRLIFCLGDAHIYSNHIEQIKTLLRRTPKPFPKLRFKRAGTIKTIDDFTKDHFEITDYDSWPGLRMDMAV